MDITTQLLVAFLCVTVGAIAGALITTLRMDKEAPDEANTAPLAPVMSAAATEASTAERALASHRSPTNPFLRAAPPRIDLAALWRDQPGGDLQAELDGKTFRSAAELTATQRRRMMLLSSDLQNWLAESREAVHPEARMAVDALSSARLDIAPEARPEPAKSIVAQIDDILQENLAGTSMYERGIHLTEEPNQGVVVWVGLDHFNGIDTVPDDQIRGIIRDAVREWEARTG